MSAIWYECKVKYRKTDETGNQKVISEPYLVDALSYTEAESRMNEEMAACQHVLLCIVENNMNLADREDFNDGNDGRTFLERFHKKKCQCSLGWHKSIYGSIDFIYGSAGEVEPLWSVAKNMLTDKRKGMMSENMFEALLSLKVNRCFWNDSDVAEVDWTRNEPQMMTVLMKVMTVLMKVMTVMTIVMTMLAMMMMTKMMMMMTVLRIVMMKYVLAYHTRH